MNDLNTLLDRAAGPTVARFDARADLARGHRALARTRRRRAAAGLVGVAAAGVVGVGIGRYAADDAPPSSAVGVDEGGRAGGISFLAQPFHAGPYTFDQTPEGWEVQGARPQVVTIAPVGFPDQEPLSFAGKLVILFDGNPPHGDVVELAGRRFWVGSSEDSTTIATRTRAGEPEGVVSIQYPSDAGWTREAMLEFLAGVHVGAGAEQGVG